MSKHLQISDEDMLFHASDLVQGVKVMIYFWQNEVFSFLDTIILRMLWKSEVSEMISSGF